MPILRLNLTGKVRRPVSRYHWYCMPCSERVWDENFSTQPHLSLSYTVSVCCPTDMCSSISSTDLIEYPRTCLTCPNSQLLSASKLSCALPCVTLKVKPKFSCSVVRSVAFLGTVDSSLVLSCLSQDSLSSTFFLCFFRDGAQRAEVGD